MFKNMTMVERVLRYFIGLFLLIWAIAGGPRWSFVGLYPLLTASFAYCPLYHLFSKGRTSPETASGRHLYEESET